ncbi:hypothetical protein SAMN05216420_10145 [Nitrosospira sp. Nl5]|nr:hypothetical protein SAMN05216420_10145 [Nitrosospira sp. Nl5]
MSADVYAVLYGGQSSDQLVGMKQELTRPQCYFWFLLKMAGIKAERDFNKLKTSGDYINLLRTADIPCYGKAAPVDRVRCWRREVSSGTEKNTWLKIVKDKS